ncbi:MAG: hypothetical protein ACLR6J_09700 [Parabacteroides merdae]
MEPLYPLVSQGEGIPALFDEWRTRRAATPALLPCRKIRISASSGGIRSKGCGVASLMLPAAWVVRSGDMWTKRLCCPEPKVGTAFWKEFARTAKPERLSRVNALATESGDRRCLAP